MANKYESLFNHRLWTLQKGCQNVVHLWMNGHQSMKTITCTGLDTYLHPTCMISKKVTKLTHERFLSLDWMWPSVSSNVFSKEHLTDKSEILVLVVFVRCKKFFVFEVLMPGLLLLCMVVGPCLGAMIWSLSLSSSLKKSSAEMNARHYRLCHQKLEILQKERKFFLDGVITNHF